MVIAAEGARADVALSARLRRLRKSAGLAAVSPERPRRTAWAVIDIAVGRKVSVLWPEAFPARRTGAAASAAVIRVPVIKGCAVRRIPLVVVDGVVFVPVVAPVVPAPPVAAEEADAEPGAEEQARSSA